MPRPLPDYDKFEHEQFRRLVELPSYTVLGQNRKIDLIQNLIKERSARAIDAAKDEQRRKSSGPLSARVEQEIEQRLQYETTIQEVPTTMITPEAIAVFKAEKLKELHDAGVSPNMVTEADLQPSWRNLIITKGNRDTAKYHVLIPSHIDTVSPSAPFQLKLRRGEKGEDRDRLYGLGVWDMHPGDSNSIALSAEIMMSPDVCAHFAFTVDEELNSSGANALIHDWADWDDIDAVVSNEIGPLPQPLLDRDMHQRIIAGRLGRQKFTVEVKIAENRLTHFAKPGSEQWNIDKIRSILLLELIDIFERSEQVQKPSPLFGASLWEADDGNVKGTLPGRPRNIAKIRFNIKAQGVDFDRQMRLFQNAITAIRAKHGWSKDISIAIRPRGSEVSYDSFSMPTNGKGLLDSHVFLDTAMMAVHKITNNKAIPAVAMSCADENLYAKALLKKQMMNGTFQGSLGGVLSIPPRGNKAHEAGEWVSIKSMMETREILRWLLTNPKGFRRLAQRKAA